MKLLAALFALSLAAVPVAFAQELEEAPGASPMDTAPPPSNEELNGAVDQLAKEKSPSPVSHLSKHLNPSAPTPAHAKAPAPTKLKKPLKKVVKAAKKSAKKVAKGKKPAPKKKKKK